MGLAGFYTGSNSKSIQYLNCASPERGERIGLVGMTGRQPERDPANQTIRITTTMPSMKIPNG